MSDMDLNGAMIEENLLKRWELIFAEMPLPDDGEVMIPATIRPDWKLEDLPIGTGPVTLLTLEQMERFGDDVMTSSRASSIKPLKQSVSDTLRPPRRNSVAPVLSVCSSD
ncbi:hypothetical protein [Magnetospirillum moscoviense]|uniref:Uncharacterized protein n=1 Tax=Magnetospirillum moscoviense TaxID=1437059 RepID=A0A178MBJ5_9PROT|nr:hypothetical protein [Magnetospirillum moscoviense]OAN46171.1 hypothetical protein A6A05_16400 [Magnetospirillum moscoviense]